ncbi:MAG TPA: hypothetical protein VIW23_18510, partial [Candidatus Acidoferrum sp.]
SRNDSVAIANTVNRKTPGQAEFVEVSNADHLLSIRGKLAESVVPAMLTWMKKTAGDALTDQEFADPLIIRRKRADFFL